ncbi:unnamed protein product [Rotaria sp. Silwood2]|nr:unnamed protein product [Rotaria sp. Silwood2]CAF3418705.1 unnamed protein product [Rotaria sp. Silwood2]CAF4404252.1 unnamed protein product [Rotaria sp. Silwood2]CAF4658788.1 unnamed protein product [Rotaria sp. Silwood2]
MKIKNRFKLNFDLFIIFYGNHRSTQQKIGVLLTLITYGFYALANSVVSAFYMALTTYPICWSLLLINIYKFEMSICLGIFSIIGYHILIRLTKSNDILISKHNWQVFSNSIFYSFANYQNPLTLSILSKWLKPTEINIAFMFIFVINQLITSFGDYVFKWIFMDTTYQHKNIILFVAGGFSFITLIISICLYIFKYRLSNTSSIINETTALLTDVDNNSDLSESNNENSIESQSTNNNSPVPIRLFTIGNLTFSVMVRAPSKFKQRLTTLAETIQEENQNLINL